MRSLLLMTALLAVASAATAAPKGTKNVQTGFLFQSLKDKPQYTYVVYVPRNYDAKQDWPLILFLHGMGESGKDGQKQIAQGIGQAILWESQRWPAIVLMPQKPTYESAWEDHEPAVMEMLKLVRKEYSIDSKRIYLTGLSQGGHGTWVLGARHTDIWAALAPICGYGDPKEIAPKLAKMPIWTFHGDADGAVPVAQTQNMVAAVKEAGGDPKMTIYPGIDHNSWDKAYRESGLWEWMFKQKKD